MHGSSHDLSCQIQNNGRYTIEAGHKHGEGCEQLWSMVKVKGEGEELSLREEKNTITTCQTL
jgi:hypothetical protein